MSGKMVLVQFTSRHSTYVFLRVRRTMWVRTPFILYMYVLDKTHTHTLRNICGTEFVQINTNSTKNIFAEIQFIQKTYCSESTHSDLRLLKPHCCKSSCESKPVASEPPRTASSG